MVQSDLAYSNRSIVEGSIRIGRELSHIYGILNDLDLSSITKNPPVSEVAPPANLPWYIVPVTLSICALGAATLYCRRKVKSTTPKTNGTEVLPKEEVKNEILKDLVEKLARLKPLEQAGDTQQFTQLLEKAGIKIPPQGKYQEIYVKIREKFPIQASLEKLEDEFRSIEREKEELPAKLSTYTFQNLTQLHERLGSKLKEVYRLELELNSTNIVTNLNFVVEENVKQMRQIRSLSIEALGLLGADLKACSEISETFKRDIEQLKDLEAKVKHFDETKQYLERLANDRRLILERLLGDTIKSNSALIRSLNNTITCIKQAIIPINPSTKPQINSFLDWLWETIGSISLKDPESQTYLGLCTDILNFLYSKESQINSKIILNKLLWEKIKECINQRAEHNSKLHPIKVLCIEAFYEDRA